MERFVEHNKCRQGNQWAMNYCDTDTVQMRTAHEALGRNFAGDERRHKLESGDTLESICESRQPFPCGAGCNRGSRHFC